MASASLAGSLRGARRPYLPSSVTKRGPPPSESAVITGQPTLIASVSTCANPSSSEECTSAHAWAA